MDGTASHSLIIVHVALKARTYDALRRFLLAGLCSDKALNVYSWRWIRLADVM